MESKCQWYSIAGQRCEYPFNREKLPFWAQDRSSARMLCTPELQGACTALVEGDSIDEMQIFVHDEECYSAIINEGMRSSVTLEAQQRNQEREIETMTGQQTEANGVKRPGAGTTGAVIWDTADRISAAKSTGQEAIPATKEEVIAALAQANPQIKPSTISVEFSKWGKFYGLPPKRVSRPRGESAAPAAKQPRINPAQPYQEGDVVGAPGQYQQLCKDAAGAWAWKPYTPPAPPVAPPPPPAPPALPPPPPAPPVVTAPPAAPLAPPVPQPTTAQVQKQPPQQAPRVWKKGDVANGHIFDGENWAPINTQKQPPAAAPMIAAPPPPAPLPPPPPAAPPAPPVVPPPVVTAPPAPPAPPAHKIGDVVNGHQLTPQGWVLVPQQLPPLPPAPPAAPWNGAPQIEVVGEEP